MSQSNTKEQNIVSGIVKNLYSGITKIAFNKRPMRVKEREQMFTVVEFLRDERLRDFEKNIGYKIKKAEYFEQALTHRSYLQVKQHALQYSNERLEFLGDSILGMIVAEYLFDQHKQVQEGELTKMRSWLVNKKSLAICARKINLDKFLLLSYSASQSLSKGNDSMLADALEALIAAIYLDAGLEDARHFIEDRLLPMMVNESLMQDTNFKSLLLEYVQAQGKSAPRYAVVEEVGPDHDKEFTVAVYVSEEVAGIGIGKNKKEAEQNAAKNALELRMHV
ncbi:MAG: ribonuclease III [Candidatus Kapabacteria bacterium]|nr:ribonuclease III [Candidatus Kapabacteria bacterium]MBX7156435.1 ribonuclease III [Bacteroidota bacterium]